MKKLLFAVFVLLSQIGFSQQLESAIITDTNHSDYDYTQLVRVYDKDNIVVLSCENGQYSFYFMQNGDTNCGKVKIPIGYSVSDFCVTENKIVYFCGKNTSGYVGRFSFDAFFNQNPIDFTTNLPNGIDTLSKIKAYKDIAHDYDNVIVLGESGSNSLIFELNDAATSPNSVCNLTAAVSTSEKWKDVDLDDKFVVVAGLDGNSIYLHRLKQGSLYPSDEGYFTNPLGIAYNTGTLFLKHLYDYKYVTVSDVYFLPKGVYTYCQIFDLSSDSQITFVYDRILMHPQKNIIRDIEYSKDDNELLVLMSSGGVGDDQWKDFVVYAPLDQGLSLPAQIKAIYFSYDGRYPYFNSVRMYKPYNYILAGVAAKPTNMLLFAKDKTQDTPTSCNKYDYIKMSGSDVGNVATPSSNLYHTSFSVSWGNSLTISPTSDTLQVNCDNYN